MTIDERLEALTQNVELSWRMHLDSEKRTAQSVELPAAVHRENEAAFKDLFNRMGRILERHDITLDDHEDRLGKLEQPEA
jgi:hypothetical protein